MTHYTARNYRNCYETKTATRANLYHKKLISHKKRGQIYFLRNVRNGSKVCVQPAPIEIIEKWRHPGAVLLISICKSI